MNKELKQYEKAVQQLADKFVEIYFDEEDYTNIYGKDYFWVGDEIGSVLCVSDTYLDIATVANAMRYKPTKDQFYDFYWNYWTNEEAETKYNIKSYMGLEIYNNK